MSLNHLGLLFIFSDKNLSKNIIVIQNSIFLGGGGYLTYILLMHHPIYQNDETISRCIDRAILIWHPFFLFLDFMMHIFFTIHRNVDFDNCRQSDNVLLPQSLDIKLLEYNSIFLNWLSIMLYMITCAQWIFFCFVTENMYMYYFINMVIKKYPSLFFINYWEMAYSVDDQGLIHFFLVKIFTNPWVKRLQDWTCTLIMAHC